MDQERERIQADLRGLLEGRVRCDDHLVHLYAGDASIYEIRPLGVVRPRGTADVVACVQYAAENGIPVHPRGGGSGLAGESLGPGLVLDFSSSMHRVTHCDAETATVQPGVTLAQLNRHLAGRGRFFAPDPANYSVTTLGSMIAIDASGSKWLRYGSTRDYVDALQVVLADGQTVRLGQRPGNGPHAPLNPNGSGDQDQAAESARVARARVAQLTESLVEVLRREARTIGNYRSEALVNGAGYQLHDIRSGDGIHLPKLLAGSEGTLGIVTEATVRTSPLPAARGVIVLLFERLEQAALASLEIRRLGAVACDLFDRRLLSIARDLDVRFDVLIPNATEALLLVEVQDETRAEVRDRLREIDDRIRHSGRMAFDSVKTQEPDEIDLYWQLVHRVVPAMHSLRGSTRALPFIEDVAIPPDVLPDFLVRLQDTFKKHRVTASLFAHAGHGQLHARPFLDLANPAHVRRMQRLAEEFYGHVLDVRGTICGEHAVGLSRTWFLRRQYGALYQVFRQIKQIFDPSDILNPGRIASESSQLLTQNLRHVSVPSPPESTESGEHAGDPPTTAGPAFALHFDWGESGIVRSARSCNGCGLCRTQAAELRMCPIFRSTGVEEASPRAKANLVRAIYTGRLDAAEMSSNATKQIADLCVHCHQCRLECPAEVDISKLAAECKAQYVATNGLRFSDWVLTHLDLISAVASRFAPLANWSIGNRQARWLMEKLLGIAQGRKLPRVARHSFLRAAHRRRLTRPSRRSERKVLYFVDTFANWYDVQLAESLVAILQHNGVAVFVHPEQMPAGMPMIASGCAEQARKLARRNVALLAEAVRQGYHVVATEPSAALCLRREYPHLLGDDDARLVAENSSEACAYLWGMHQRGKLQLNLKRVNVTVGYHMPCHLKALGTGSLGENLLRLIPGLTVRNIEQGCSGMAGTFGLRRDHYRGSLRAGWGLISSLRDSRIQIGVTECSACKLQMEQGTTKPTIHPLKLLALSYQLMPEVARRIHTPGEELIAT